jgi:hypothetical protein
MSDNPFDLTKLVSNKELIEKPKYKPIIYTSQEQKDMLKSYQQVPNAQWTKIPIGTNIRYIRKDGEMRKGGYIRYIDPEGKFMSISIDPLQQSKRWKLPLDGVAEIWKLKQENNIVKPNDNIIDQESIVSLKEDIRQLKIEIQRVMNQQKRIIKSVGVNALRIDKMEGRRL